MSSTPYIEIDWSSTSQHSFPQLGEPTPPENNSDDILYNSELPAVLSAKDILSLDIDDIYPYTYSTLHFEDNETEDYYNDEDYFQQLLKSNLNAEIETDIISSPILATAPLSENLPTDEKKTTLLVSLKKFHVTTPKRTDTHK
ncbi:hypothetical protein RhiirC2_785755 [Rhizophagus irregularis]|uniref:Uncharacterized protein n=1 Tax=Rhizophagus irregularis TaxID=588596 RepID=A0A2N1MKT2_9GLOM|nr:hypothetical protein RhiirC2_802906 [Rhizophagus irregularis]PKK62248.1 hypothetical protein RhiirC2_790650 [Rhizophagus irregularis]PKK65713.1 hypothetical protein RhiirC2_785755 [Rhizophagus irregularis]